MAMNDLTIPVPIRAISFELASGMSSGLVGRALKGYDATMMMRQDDVSRSQDLVAISSAIESARCLEGVSSSRFGLVGFVIANENLDRSL